MSGGIIAAVVAVVLVVRLWSRRRRGNDRSSAD